ncbi:unnamed protein product [Linum trigynum]|uniref:FBD domain-containing protein n=1 Tax=Linum trigynum TaxID=586398 RepID=A0AAV2D288_9ROSI
MEKQGEASAAGEEEVPVDRISALLDDIIHQILARLRSTKEAARTIVLSKRWVNLWRSYPVLEFDDRGFLSKQTAERLAKSVAAKFGSNNSTPPLGIRSVRIDFADYFDGADWDVLPCSAFLDDLLKSAAAATRSQSPREIDISCGYMEDFGEFDGRLTYDIPKGLLLLPCRQFPQFRGGLEILKLEFCSFREFVGVDLVGVGSSLRELTLRYVSLPDDRILNGMIAGASRLESLTLSAIVEIRRLQVRNLPNLRALRCYACDVEDLEITGATSLEILCLSSPLGGELEVSSMPNLRKLEIDAWKLTDQKVNKLIAESPSLETLKLTNPAQVRNLKIVSSDRFRELTLVVWKESRAMAIEIDAPRLSNFSYHGAIVSFLRSIELGSKKKKKKNSTTTTAVPFYWYLYGHMFHNFNNLRQLYPRISEFRLTLDISFQSLSEWRRQEVTDEVSVVPRIERVILPWDFSTLPDMDSFLDDLFQNFHPKYLSLTQKSNLYSISEETLLLALKYVCKTFHETDLTNRCGAECKCWRHQLKDVKMVKRAAGANGGTRVEDDADNNEVVDISTVVISTRTEIAEIWLLFEF